MIHIIDLKNCNLGSIVGAFQHVGVSVKVVDDGIGLTDARSIALPGVGAFAASMQKASRSGIVAGLKEKVIAHGVPLLGVCLGMQLLGDASEEHELTQGFGFIPGTVRKLKTESRAERIPNNGWCDVTPSKETYIFPTPQTRTYYFNHSYAFDCNDSSDIAARLSFGGGDVVAAVQRGHVAGVQFHPEKSQDAGLDLLAAWVEWLRGKGRL
jgi:glutamine amidotransferase